jgi:hypothetical protein
MWLKYKLAEYDAQDEQQEDTRGLEPWELRADQAAMDYEPIDKDVARLEDIMAKVKLTNNENGGQLETQNAAETNHPWHNYIPWSACYYADCLFHYSAKQQHNHFPTGQIPVYYSRTAMKEIIERRRSTGQLQH